jgi:hypothetical protein
MDKTEILDKLIEDGNGYLITSQATNKGISKWYLAEYIKKRNMEKVAQGVYLSEEAWLYELYLLSLRNCKIYFSQETALYLHGLMERSHDIFALQSKRGIMPAI